MDKFWDVKIKEVTRISKEYGYEELNVEFWINKPAILCSLVIDIYKSKEEKKRKNNNNIPEQNLLPLPSL